MAKKNYTEQEERMARFAKAMGHPARMAILRFLAEQDSCFFGAIHEAGIPPSKVKYCIDSKNWTEARSLFAGFFSDYAKKNSCCK